MALVVFEDVLRVVEDSVTQHAQLERTLTDSCLYDVLYRRHLLGLRICQVFFYSGMCLRDNVENPRKNSDCSQKRHR